MYSLNVPVPGEVGALAAEFARRLPEAHPRRRGERTLVCKRLDGRDDAATYHHLEARARETLRGAPAFEARVVGIDLFESPPTGEGPVAYLDVESPGLERLHSRLCEAFDPVEGIEGNGYTPHVTIARGGSIERARALCEAAVDPVTWTVSELSFWDAERSQSVSRVSLPA